MADLAGFTTEVGRQSKHVVIDLGGFTSGSNSVTRLGYTGTAAEQINQNSRAVQTIIDITCARCDTGMPSLNASANMQFLKSLTGRLVVVAEHTTGWQKIRGGASSGGTQQGATPTALPPVPTRGVIWPM